MNSLSSVPDVSGTVPLHSQGYVRHWLVTGPVETPYNGPPGDENVLRREAPDQRIVEPPFEAAIGCMGPLGKEWRFRYPGGNFFVEYSAFFFQLTLSDSYAFTWIEADEEREQEAYFWAAGMADLWVNGNHITRLDATRYMWPHFQEVKLALKRGLNKVCIRLQCFGVRDTRILFGLQMKNPEGLHVHIPGAALQMKASRWLDGVRTEGNDSLVATQPAPSGVEVNLPGDESMAWPPGKSRVAFVNDAVVPVRVSVKISVEAQILERPFEITPPGIRAAGVESAQADVRSVYLERTAASIGDMAKPHKGCAILARHLLKQHSAEDAAAFAATIRFIEGRGDCADFALAALLRMAALGLAAPEESAEIRRIALAFRYWSDEPGNDGMCFWSENHSLLFHGCQMIAGGLYPDAIFSNSGRTGAEQATLGAARCVEWLDRVEPRGLDEFNSSSYLPITVGALLNLVDFSGDVRISRRAAALIDRLYEYLAWHAFQGVVITPQGRVYRNVLHPGLSGNQALLSYAGADAAITIPGRGASGWTGEWLAFLASSQNYEPPSQLGELTRGTLSRRYRQSDVEIVVHKTPAWILTSLAVPKPGPQAEGEHAALNPGMAGYQQHLWQATLAPDCHVFVNHPGCSTDDSPSRPGYWYGNGVLPRVRQREGVLQAIHRIPDGSGPHRVRTDGAWFWPPCTDDPFDLHPIPFTHAHWPSRAFDREEFRGNWLFGKKGHGCIALWCSAPLEPHNDLLTGCEFRAWSCRSAWVAICGEIESDAGFEKFIQECMDRNPVFDPVALILRMGGEEPLAWNA